VETIRYYQRRGLMREPARPLGGIRRYAQEHARRLRFIKEAQKLGFNLDEVGELLSLEDGLHCREVEGSPVTSWQRCVSGCGNWPNRKRPGCALGKCHNNRGKLRCPLISSLESATS